MRFVSSLDAVIGTPSKVKVLRVLSRFPTKEFTGRELAELASASAPQVNHALGELERAGLVRKRTVGAAIAWQLRTENVFVPRIRELFAQESNLLEDIINTIRSGLPLHNTVRVVLYGSVARRKLGDASDVDLFIEVAGEKERDNLRPDLEELASKVYLRYGIPLSTLIYTSREVKKPKNPRLVQNINTEGIAVS
jgi:predicted nucleotidyltransferase